MRAGRQRAEMSGRRLRVGDGEEGVGVVKLFGTEGGRFPRVSCREFLGREAMVSAPE